MIGDIDIFSSKRRRYRINLQIGQDYCEGCARNDYNKSGVGIKRIILYPEAYGPYPDAPEYGVYVFE